MKDIKSYSHFASGVIVACMFLAAGVSFAAPTQPPSSGSGVELPIHVGSEAQTKAGNLTVQGQVDATSLCISGDCKTSWPSSSVQSTTSSGSTSSNVGSCTFTQYDNNTNNYYCDLSYSVNVSTSGPGVPVSIASSSVLVDGASWNWCTVNGNYAYQLCPCSSYYSYNCPSSSQTLSSSVTLSGSTITFSGTKRFYGQYYNNTQVVGNASGSVLYIY